MRCACIDIGSNTTRLLVAEPDGAGGLREIGHARAFNRLGAGCGPDREPGAEQVAAAAAAVDEQARLAAAHGATRIVAVATAAVRSAPDPEALAARIGGRVAVRVLDGEQEARLAFRGATCALRPRPEGPVAVVDVGGGSTELVVGTCGAVPGWAASLPFGSASLTEDELHADPPAGGDLDRVRARATAAFAALDVPPAASGLAVGGSATSVAQLLGGGSLSHEALARALDALCAAPAATLGPRHGLHPDRMRMLPAALVVLDVAAQKLAVELRLARGGLREGVVLAMLDGEI